MHASQSIRFKAQRLDFDEADTIRSSVWRTKTRTLMKSRQGVAISNLNSSISYIINVFIWILLVINVYIDLKCYFFISLLIFLIQLLFLYSVFKRFIILSFLLLYFVFDQARSFCRFLNWWVEHKFIFKIKPLEWNKISMNWKRMKFYLSKEYINFCVIDNQ